jgi:hypothetical protein
MVPFELETLGNADMAAGELIAAAQAAAAKVASGYRARRKEAGAPSLTLPRKRGRENPTPQGLEIPGGLRVLNGGKR